MLGGTSSLSQSTAFELIWNDRIGRITKNFLTKINKAVVVDIVEPVKKFTDEISNPENFKEEKETGQIGQIINMGLEQWTPEQGVYWMIWK